MSDNKIVCSFCGKEGSKGYPLIQSKNETYICLHCVAGISKFMKLDESPKSVKKDMIDKENVNADTKTKEEKAGNPDKSDKKKHMFDMEGLSPSVIKKKLDEYVIGQDDAKEAISVAVYNHYKKIRHPDFADTYDIGKSNILMIGPTGCGKTYLVKTLAKILDVPVSVSDATSLTEAGYVGDDVESILTKLYQKADCDIEKAEFGIIYIDEIDKLARPTGAKRSGHDVAGEAVQQGLLKILEGSEIMIPKSPDINPRKSDLIKINTKNILFICGGAFEGINELVLKKKNPQTIGFRSEMSDPETEKDKIEIEDEVLLEYGMLPEFVGRLPVITTLDPLTEETLVNILVKPKNSLVSQYRALLAMDRINAEITEDALKAIAEKAMKKNTGARGLRSIMEKMMQKTMYNAPDITGMKHYKKIIFDTTSIISGEGTIVETDDPEKNEDDLISEKEKTCE